MIASFRIPPGGRLLSLTWARVLVLGAALIGAPALADEIQTAEEAAVPEQKVKFYGQLGGYFHWNDDPDFEGPPVGGGVEAHVPSNWFGGIFLFNNSFGEFSQYYYVGKKWNPFEKHPHWNVKLSGGLIYGYSKENIDEFPVHFAGFGPVLVPSIGYKKGRVGWDVGLMGQAGLMFTVGVDLN